jgi:hypothetical protein
MGLSDLQLDRRSDEGVRILFAYVSAPIRARVGLVSKFLIRNPKAFCFPVKRYPESVKEAVLP